MCTTGLPLSPHYGASKIRWLLRNSPGVSTTHQLAAGPLAAFLLHQLTQESTFAIDVTNAARMQLVDLRFPCCWDAELLAKFDVPDHVLPPIRPSRHQYGTLSMNRDAPIPLRLVCGDQFAALHAEDDRSSAPVLLNLGTGGFVLVATESMPPPVTKLLRSPGAANEYVLEGTINGAGAAIDWAARRWGLDPRKLPWDAWELGPPTDLKFVNFVGGRGSPLWQSTGRSYWIDDSDVEQDPIDVRACMLAVVDSIADLVVENLIEMRRLGMPCDHIRITGGLSNLNYLRRRIVDRCQCRVDRAARTEATAHGVINLLKQEMLIKS